MRIEAHDFMPDVKVGRFMLVVMTIRRFCFIDKNWNHSLELKLTSVIFIVFDNFFKLTIFYVCLLLWNTNAISRISITNSIIYPKHNQIHFHTGTQGKTHHNLVSEFQALLLKPFVGDASILVSSSTARLILIPKCILSCLHFQSRGNLICHFVSCCNIFSLKVARVD